MEKIDIKDLTLDEKLLLLTAKNAHESNDLGGKLPALWFADGHSGLRYVTFDENGNRHTKPAYQYPSAVCICNSWNLEMSRLAGAVVAEDCIENDVAVLLAPGINIKRTPLCGRNFEYFSEDPYLAGMFAKSYIEGLQSKGIGASVKHFCANNREYDRLHQTSEVDERTLQEIYYTPFKIAIEADPWTVMCCYNPVNGVYAAEHKKLLYDVLRGQLGFKGTVISDWGAVKDRAKSLKARLDLEMPSNKKSFENLKKAYEDGFITDEEIDYAVSNILSLINRYLEAEPLRKVAWTREERKELSVKIAEEGIVLLKNEDKVLPLKPNCKVAIAGGLAKNPSITGGGSSMVNFTEKAESLTEALSAELEGCSIDYVPVYEFNNCILSLSLPTVINQKAAMMNADRSDYSIVVVGTHYLLETECYDRTTLRLLPCMEDLILKVSKYNKNTIVIIEAGSAVDVSPFEKHVKAIIFAGFGGAEVNRALARILAGKVNPSGKLSETFPMSLEDTLTKGNPGNGFVERYDEGVLVGYRHYDFHDIPVMYPFGHGLSYSEFEYSDLKVNKLGETEFEVEYSVTNRSDRDGMEVSQVYVRDKFCMVLRPVKELKAFSKDFIKAGQTKRVRVKLGEDAFAYYSTAYDKWFVENGEFEILVGASSRDIRLSQTIEIKLDERFQNSV